MGKALSAAEIGAPEPLSADHAVVSFDCGKPALNDWLKERALNSEGRSARTYIVCAGDAVVGYYALSTGGVAHSGAPRHLRANLPDPTPVIVIGRLAVDRKFHGCGVGKALLKDALARILSASKIVGARAVVAHAIDDDVIPFYRDFGFQSFPNEPRTFWMALATVAAAR